MSENIFKNPALIAYVVKCVQDKYPSNQIGKTYIQKMMYLLKRKGILDVSYSIHYYGPYSMETAYELNFAENIGIISIKWIDDKGYFISAVQDNFEKLEQNIIDHEKQAVAEVVDRFGRFKAIELSIIATALYLQDNSEVSDTRLVEAVHNLKPEYPNDYIKHILEEGGIINN